MKTSSKYKHFGFFTFIITLGLGFALTLPWLANHQSMAAQSERNESGDLLVSRSSEINDPNAPRCFATLDDGATLPYSSDDATAVQQAVDAASPGDKVKVAGICVGAHTRAGFTQTVYISKSLTLEGGHTTDDWTLEPDPETYTTTLDANRLGRVVLITGTVDVNLDSLFLTGGNADNTFNYHSTFGGGIYSNSALTLTNIIVYSNTAVHGGGMFSDLGSELFIKNGKFLNNKAGEGGGLVASIISKTTTLDTVEFTGNKVNGYAGGAWAWGGNWIIKNAYFAGNESNLGGGFYNYYANTKISNAVFVNNIATGSGGGIYNFNSQTEMTNTLFSGNKGDKGGGLVTYWGKSTLINTTVSGNYASNNGGGIWAYDSSNDIFNAIVWNNQDQSGPGTGIANIALDLSGKITLTNSILQSSGGSDSWALDPTKYVDGGFNKDTDPLFVTPVDPAAAPTADGDLRLTENSPAIDMGNNDFITTLYDLDNYERKVDGDLDGTAKVDMGAYEYQIPYKYDINLPLIVH